jgi:hypothetical protein
MSIRPCRLLMLVIGCDTNANATDIDSQATIVTAAARLRAARVAGASGHVQTTTLLPDCSCDDVGAGCERTIAGCDNRSRKYFS